MHSYRRLLVSREPRFSQIKGVAKLVKKPSTSDASSSFAGCGPSLTTTARGAVTIDALTSTLGREIWGVALMLLARVAVSAVNRPTGNGTAAEGLPAVGRVVGRCVITVTVA